MYEMAELFLTTRFNRISVIVNSQFGLNECGCSVKVTVHFHCLCLVYCTVLWELFIVICSKVKHLDTELHIASTTLKSLELSESKVQIFMLLCLLKMLQQCS